MEETTTADQLKKIAELESKVTVAGIPVPYAGPDAQDTVKQAVLKKFLLARQWNVDKAFQMLKSTVEFRMERNLENKSLFPCPQNFTRGYDEADCMTALGKPPREPDAADAALAAMQTSYAGVWHKWDKQNRPVFIERTGLIDTKRLVETLQRIVKPGEDYKVPALNSHLYANEVGGGLVHYQRMRTKSNVSQVTVVMDCEGLGFGHLYKPAVAVLEAMSKMDQEYYPEGLHKLFLVNCPRMVTVAYNLCKGWLDVRVQQKVVFAKPHETAAKLLAEIAPECLPEHLGGTCKCGGGCIPMPTGTLPDSMADAAITDKIVVPASQISTRYHPMKKGETASWEFCTEVHNISFSATFGSTKVIIENHKVDCCKEPVTGSYTAPDDGVLGLSFDNTYSWMNAKSILLRLVIL